VKLYGLDKDYAPTLDRETIACLTDAERAAVGFVTPTLGGRCIPAPGDDDAHGHLDCPLTSALGLGYQCEEKHKEFLQRWLPKDAPAQCRRWPDTAYTQETLTTLTLTTVGQILTVDYEASGTTGPGGKSWSWSETLVFEADGERLVLASRKMKGTRVRI
jgi:hypothetical protein